MNPWDDVPYFKNESGFLNWLRSQTRRIWSRHPTKLEYKKNRRYKAPVGKNGKMVFVSDCEICGKQHRDCEVDHIKAGGSFHDWGSYTKWAERILWVGMDDIRELCPDCHSIVTYQQSNNCSWEEAVSRKMLVSKLKQPVTIQKKELTDAGFTDSMIRNKGAREECYVKLLRDVKNDA